jgi:urease accessory protein
MIYDRVLGNIETDAPDAWDGRAQETIELAWFECYRRAVKKCTSAGRSVGLLPPLGTVLRHGDVVAHVEGGIVVVDVLPCELLDARPTDVATMGTVAAEIGNLHVPLEVRPDGSLLILPDGPAEAVLRRCGVPYERVTSRFAPLRASVPEEFQLAGDFKLTRRDNA